MIARNLLLVVVGAVAMSQVPKLLITPSEPVAQPATMELAKAVAPAPVSPGSYSIPANEAGHYVTSFRLNGRTIEGLVDTGATFVAMNEKTARQLGFTGNGLDFRYAVNTANGPAQAAHVVLDRVEIGSLRVSSVEAFVLKDEALDGTLIGMSFLRKLKSFSVEDGKMVLRQ